MKPPTVRYNSVLFGDRGAGDWYTIGIIRTTSCSSGSFNPLKTNQPNNGNLGHLRNSGQRVGRVAVAKLLPCCPSSESPSWFRTAISLGFVVDKPNYLMEVTNQLWTGGNHLVVILSEKNGDLMTYHIMGFRYLVANYPRIVLVGYSSLINPTKIPLVTGISATY